MFKEFPNVIYLIPFFFDMGKKEVADSKKSIENKYTDPCLACLHVGRLRWKPRQSPKESHVCMGSQYNTRAQEKKKKTEEEVEKKCVMGNFFFC